MTNAQSIPIACERTSAAAIDTNTIATVKRIVKIANMAVAESSRVSFSVALRRASSIKSLTYFRIELYRLLAGEPFSFDSIMQRG